MEQQLTAQLVDIRQRRIYPATIYWKDGIISRIEESEQAPSRYILPGFVDAHVHIESSMLVPSEFARLAVVHGTVATVSDPHEIANVLGIEGVEFMIENGEKVPFKFYFGAPSCVPATSFETAGAEIGPEGIEQLLQRPDILYLSEMMNYPGVLHQQANVLAKIKLAQQYGKPIDGHAPGLRGEAAKAYAAAGISTDHECFTYEEAREKIDHGMKILIREGSAAKNFEVLIPLLAEFPERIMFCSDDKHPDDLIKGHINQLVVRALQKGHDLFDILQAACLNPIEHYQLPIGQLRLGDPADFIVVDSPERFQVLATYIDGQQLASEGKSLIARQPIHPINQFRCQAKQAADFAIKAKGDSLQAIKALDGEIVTERQILPANVSADGLALSDVETDALKIAIVNRYQEAPPAVAFIHGFGLRQGAIASCVGHDSHNIIAVGTTDEAIAQAVNLVIEHQGGISAVGADREKVLPLPVAGIMSDGDGYEVASRYAEIDQFVKQDLSCQLNAPFTTLSFMGLLVIPDLKLSDLGLFDGKTFSFCDPFV
ncbi:MAG: adenine deaminase [Bacteroidota bacterium]